MEHIKIMVENDPETLESRFEEFQKHIKKRNYQYVCDKEMNVKVLDTQLTVLNKSTAEGVVTTYTLMIFYQCKERFRYWSDRFGNE